MKNYEKRDKYAMLMESLKKSLKNEYYYEAIFIEYAIIEDRTSSLLRHLNISCVDPKTNRAYTLNNKLKIIKNNKLIKKDKYIKKHLTDELISDIYCFKDKRNPLIHDLVNLSYENEDIKLLALQGNDLIKKLNNKTNLVNKYLEKINGETKISV